MKSKLSRNGEIVIDERTNTLIISEVRDRMELLEKLIGVLDTPTPQVSIEARIVEATSTFIKNLGIQWGFKGIADPFYGNRTSISFPNKIQLDGAMIPQGIVTKGIGGPLGGYAVNCRLQPLIPRLVFPSPMFLTLSDSMWLYQDSKLQVMAGLFPHQKLLLRITRQQRSFRANRSTVQTVANFTVTTRYVNAALELRATPDYS